MHPCCACRPPPPPPNILATPRLSQALAGLQGSLYVPHVTDLFDPEPYDQFLAPTGPLINPGEDSRAGRGGAGTKTRLYGRGLGKHVSRVGLRVRRGQQHVLVPA